MPRFVLGSAPLIALVAALAAPAGAQETYSGHLGPGDARRSGGEYTDRYTYRVPADAAALVVSNSSRDFDAYLVATSPSGQRYTDDDGAGAGLDALLTVDHPQAGVWTIEATAYRAGATGGYVLTMGWQGGGYPLPPPPGGGGDVVMHEGYLGHGDPRRGDGQFFDRYTYYVYGGAPALRVEHASEDFDAYLVAVSPSGREYTDDDGADTPLDSRIVVDYPEEGTWQVLASSLGAGSTGAYVVTMGQGQGGGGAGTYRETGYLGSGDPRRPDGAYYDGYTYSIPYGARAFTVANRSSAFDAYLVVTSPSGQRYTDDDGGDGLDALLNVDYPEAGAWRVEATSYRAGATGSYVLDVTVR